MTDFDPGDYFDRPSLRDILKAAVASERRAGRRCTMADLTVLAPANDPYRLDTDAGHRDGAWLADIVERLGPGTKHLRGLHYSSLSLEAVKPNGRRYENTDKDWQWISERSAKCARWLDYLDWDRIIDQRNAEAVIREYSEPNPRAHLVSGIDIDLPTVTDIMPRPATSGFHAGQPYHLVFVGEKASLEPVLDPIAALCEADLFLPTGELSDTRIYQMAMAAIEDGRPLVVLYFADCDPAGWQMAISVGRKLQAFSDQRGPFEFVEHRVALTPEQVRAYGLPSTPLKPKERRRDRWQRLMGVQQTEIDALASLQPDLLRQITMDAIAPFWDATLGRRVREARSEWLRGAAAVLARDADTDLLARAREDAGEQIVAMRRVITELNERLIDSSRPFAYQCYRLINSKAYEEEDDDE